MAHDGAVAFLAIATRGGRPDPRAMADVMRRHGLTPVTPAAAS
jgi:hypothetical protein